jgi:hypothetical protein
MTDNRDTQIHYMNKYPNRMIIFDTIASSQDCFTNRCTQISQTVIEVYIAAHAKVFQGSKLSSVSETIRLLRDDIKLENCPVGYKPMYSVSVSELPKYIPETETPT